LDTSKCRFVFRARNLLTKASFGLVNKCLQVLPDFLKDTNYQNPTDPFHCAFQRAVNDERPGFIWLGSNPKALDNFTKHMAAYHEGKPAWTSVTSFEEQLQGWTGERPLFVDVGGGTGTQCTAFREAVGDIPGRVILEELPPVLAQIPDTPGIETLGVDFFEPQQVKGSKYYYLRNILHDYPDHRCEIILKNISDVMEPDSLILINELVIPNVGAYRQATEVDLVLMAGLASMERTEQQWYDLLEGKCGLKILSIKTFNKLMGDSLIECKPVRLI
jgi:demethylsterigmatocystin 6-O-methyltransferase